MYGGCLFETGRGRVFGTRDEEGLLKAMDLDMLHVSEVHIRATVFDQCLAVNRYSIDMSDIY